MLQARLKQAYQIVSRHDTETAVNVAKFLSNIIHQTFSVQTVCCGLKAAGMKVIAKKKKPFLSKSHKKAKIDFAITHQHWTVENWKKVVWSDKIKINRFGSDERKWVWKKAREGLSNRLVEGT
jgi:hypothetical protein